MPELVQLQQVFDSSTSYQNQPVGQVNDHVVRLSRMSAPYPWHLHPDSDETFIGVEGIVIIETPDRLYELGPGCLLTIERNTPHRTRPKEGTTLNMTVEKKDLQTQWL